MEIWLFWEQQRSLLNRPWTSIHPSLPCFSSFGFSVCIWSNCLLCGKGGEQSHVWPHDNLIFIEGKALYWWMSMVLLNCECLFFFTCLQWFCPVFFFLFSPHISQFVLLVHDCPLPGELWLTCGGAQPGQLSIGQDKKINSGQHWSHYTYPLQPAALLVQ